MWIKVNYKCYCFDSNEHGMAGSRRARRVQAPSGFRNGVQGENELGKMIGIVSILNNLII